MDFAFICYFRVGQASETLTRLSRFAKNIYYSTLCFHFGGTMCFLFVSTVRFYFGTVMR